MFINRFFIKHKETSANKIVGSKNVTHSLLSYIIVYNIQKTIKKEIDAHRCSRQSMRYNKKIPGLLVKNKLKFIRYKQLIQSTPLLYLHIYVISSTIAGNSFQTNLLKCYSDASLYSFFIVSTSWNLFFFNDISN